MNILAIETSCDETALSIIQTNEKLHSPNFKLLSDLVISQIDIHAQYGGVFPALAKREHAKNLTPLFEQALIESELYYQETEAQDISPNIINQIQEILHREPELFEDLVSLLKKIVKADIGAIMVTHGPGLAPALWVGINFARALSVAWNIPIIPVNHMEGHVSSITLKDDYLNEQEALLSLSSFEFPIISLLISGGHTQLVLVKQWGEYEILGETIDDAVGEAFDKVARTLNMEYPGGPKISQAAQEGISDEHISLPRPMINSKDYRFSFSGLKTAVRYLVEDLESKGNLDKQTISNIAMEFEHAVTEVLIKKTSMAMIEYSAKGLIIAGGVSANAYIAKSFKELLIREFPNTKLYFPHKRLCGDNSLMIASAGFINWLKQGDKAFIAQEKIVARSNLSLSDESTKSTVEK